MNRRLFLASVVSASAAGLGLVPESHARDPLSGAVRIQPSHKWADMRGRFAAQCRAGHPSLREWQSLVSFMKGLGDDRRLAFADDYFNAVQYGDDRSVFGVPDHWATPLDFLAQGGDCEDYAAAKYLALAACGVPESCLRVLIVRVGARSQPHAVTAVQGGQDWYILDNLYPSPSRAQARSGILTLYAISGDERWMYLSARRSVS